MTCGVEWFSNQRLAKKYDILQIQNSLLSEHLLRAGHLNQLNELRLKTLDRNAREFARNAESTKHAAASLQRDFNEQQGALEIEKQDHALTRQTLEGEAGRRADAERCLAFEQETVQKLTEVLCKLELPKGKLPEDPKAGFFRQWQLSQSEVIHLRGQLQRTVEDLDHKKRILQSLSADYQVQAQSRSEIGSI